MKPDFKNNPFIKSKALKKSSTAQGSYLSAEGIVIKPNYQKSDIKGEVPYCNSIAGKYPFLRGPYSTMYTSRPWTIRQYAGFSTAKESNDFYKKNLASGQKGLSIAFDLPTHRGYDSDNPIVSADVGKTGVAIDTVEDMKLLLKDIPLDKISVSMTMNGAVIPIMAFFIVAAQESGVDKSLLAGTIQNDILKEFMVRNTYIYPPKPSMRIISDIFKYTAKYMPKFNSISISGYHIQEAGATNDIELTYTLANGLTYLKAGLEAGLDIDAFAPRLSFFWAVGMNHFMEVAKMRAARVLWARIVKQFKPKNKKSLMLRTHCQTSGWSLTAQFAYNNITRTCVEAFSAAIGGTQSLHTNALDEALALPTPYSAEIARNTQLYIQEETDLCKTVDPYGGAYYIEKLTSELIKNVWKNLEIIESEGGMLEAIESGVAKSSIEKAATEKQAKIDAKEDLIIGVNAFFSNLSNNIDTLEVDNNVVLKNQLHTLSSIKQSRNNTLVSKALEALREAAKDEHENLLEKAVIAAKHKATLGEISSVIEETFGRYNAKHMTASGVYINTMNNTALFTEARTLCNNLAEKIGRQPRIIVAKLGQDGHDRGANVIATAFVDIGFDVDVSPLFSNPKEVVKHAVENDVHVIGISSLAAGHKTLVPDVIKALKQLKREDIMVVLGGVIPKKDFEFLYEIGVDKIFSSGSNICVSAIEIIKSLNNKVSI